MNSDLMLALASGIDIPIPELQLVIHPPKIKEIAFMGEKNFFSAANYLCLKKEQITQDKTILSSYTNFEILMKVLKQPGDNKKEIVQNLCSILFPSYQTIILPNSILLNGENNESIVLDKNNFDIFQEWLREILCLENLFQGDNIMYKPVNEAATKIAEKIYAGRRKIAEINNKQQSQSSVLARYLSILEVAQIISPLDGPELNLFQLFDLMQRYIAFSEQDIDSKVRLAGGKPDKEVENWMRDMYLKS